jgi:hypothetical protein
MKWPSLEWYSSSGHGDGESEPLRAMGRAPEELVDAFKW